MTRRSRFRPFSRDRTGAFRVAGVLAAVLATAGCASTPSRHADAFFAGRLDESEERVRAAAAADEDAVDVFALDRASILLARGEPRRAERLMRVVRDRWDYLEQTSAAEASASVATDERARAYAGEEYERVLLRAMLTIANLLDDGGDAYAYSLQAAAKQAELSETGMLPNAAVPFLSAVVRRDMPLHASEAERAWRQFWDITDPPEGAFAMAPFGPTDDGEVRTVSASNAAGPPPGRVCVFCFVGRGPRKVASRVEVGPSVGVRVEGVALEADVSLQVPDLIASPNRPQEVTVSTGEVAVRADVVLDVTNLARRESDRTRPQRIRREAVRAAAKTAAAGAAAVVADAHDSPELALLAGLALAASRGAERCDLRHWSHLPHQIRAAWLPLPPGDRTISIADGTASTTAPIRVRSGRTGYALAWLGDDGLVGGVVVDAASRVE